MEGPKRPPAVELQGKDIALLQEVMLSLGYWLPAEELKDQKLGPGSREAAYQFQKQFKLEQGGDVDERISKAMQIAEKALQNSNFEKLASWAETLRLKLPSEWLRSLADLGIRTLADIRAAGGLRRLEALSIPMDDPRLGLLEGHANLELLTSDVETRSRLIEGRFQTVIDLAQAGSAEIDQRLGETIGALLATDLQKRAKSLVGLVNNHLLGLYADPKIINQVGPNLRDIFMTPLLHNISAISPVAYLNDLLNYSKQNLITARGLQAAYRNFQSSPYYNPKAGPETHLDTNIDIHWGTDSPAPGIDPEKFLVNWTGYISARYSGLYTFTLLMNTATDGCVYIDDKDLGPRVPGSGIAQGTITLEVDKLYMISVYVWVYRQGLSAFAQLYWECPGKQAKEIVPGTRLYPVQPEFTVMDTGILTRMFFQPFQELAQSEEGALEKVRQVRLCIEVLRKYWVTLTQQQLPDLQNRNMELKKQRKDYYEKAYKTLLGCMNTSADDIRQAACADFQARQALADRLGFDLETRLAIMVCGDFDGDCVDEIALAPRAGWATGNAFQAMKYDSQTRKWNRVGGDPGLPLGADFAASQMNEPAKFAVAGHFTSQEYEDIAIAGAYGPGVGFWVLGCEFGGVYAEPIGWKRRNQINEGFEYYCSGYVSARFAVAGDFDGDGLDELAIAANLDGCNAFWVMNYDQYNKVWGSLGKIANHEFNASFFCHGQGVVGTALFAVAGDFDGDGKTELAVAIDGPGAMGGSFWVMKWDDGNNRWIHLSTGRGLPLDADLSCGGSGPAHQAVVGKFSGNNSPAMELAVVLDGPNPCEYTIKTMKYDPVKKDWISNTSYTYASYGAPSLLLAGDFDNDQKTELAIIRTNSRKEDTPVQVIKLKKLQDPINHRDLWEVLCEVNVPDLRGKGNGAGNTLLNLVTTGRFSAPPSIPGMTVQVKDELALAPDLSWSGQNPVWVLTYDSADHGLKHLSPFPDHPLTADFTCWGRPDQLDQLFLQPKAESPPANMETLLEALFGLQSTNRDGLSTGVIFDYGLFGDIYLRYWQFLGIRWNVNTDPEGFVYLSFISRRGGISRIEAFRDAARTEMVASGPWSGSSDSVKLVEKNNSGLSCTLEVAVDSPFTVNNFEAKVSFSLIPKLACWRLKRLRRLWFKEDWPENSYPERGLPIIDPDLIGPEDFRHPYCTPDPAAQPRAFDIWLKRRKWVDQLITQFAGNTGQMPNFQGILETFPDIELMLSQMTVPVEYHSFSGLITVQVWDCLSAEILEALLLQIDRSPQQRDKACESIENNLHLTMESFRRLMSFRSKALKARMDPVQAALTDGEWEEVFSILTQASKVRLFKVWQEEEAALGIKLGPEEFWRAFKEPVVGTWSPKQVNGDCLVDPDRISREELPVSGLDSPVVSLWQERRQWLDQKQEDLRARCESGGDNGVYIVLEDIYGTDQCQSFEKYYDIITSGAPDDDNDKVKVLAEIQNNLLLTVEEFCSIMDLMNRSLQTDAKITVMEWNRFYVLMARVYRQLNGQPWLKIEVRRGITDWFQVLRHRLPQWRASANDRILWQQSLDRNTRMCLIDPSVITQEYFVLQGKDNIAQCLYLERDSWIKSAVAGYHYSLQGGDNDSSKITCTDALLGVQQGLRALHLITADTILGPNALREARKLFMNCDDLADTIALGLHTTPERLIAIHQDLSHSVNVHNLRQTVIEDMHLSLSDFAKVADILFRMKNGETILPAEWDELSIIFVIASLAARVFEMPESDGDKQKRLKQLGLSSKGFDHLRQVRMTVANGLPLIPEERNAFCDTLAQAVKTLQYGRWQEDEQSFGVTLTPDFFRLPAAASASADLKDAALEEWEKRLQERIDQELNLHQIIQASVDLTEEAALPMFRDAMLLAAAPDNGHGVEVAARYLADVLMIDTQAPGSLFTTRAFQAIETLQGILWSVRNGLVAETHPGLQIGTERFDEDWKWLGSYATWRSAMQAFMYPENVLLPSLRKWQTPGFIKFIKAFSNYTRLTPEKACQIADQYKDYFRDVCSLRQDAGVVVGDLTYLYARSTVSNRVYWCAVANPSDFSRGCPFWEEIQAPGLVNVTELIGAVAYKWSHTRYVYLFVVIQDRNRQLAFVRYNEGAKKWEDAKILPLGSITDFSTALKETAENEPPLLVIWRMPDKKAFVARLNEEGTIWEDAGLLEGEISKPSWGPLTPISTNYNNTLCTGYRNGINWGGGIAVAHLNASDQNDLLVFHCDTNEYDRAWLGHYQIGFNLDRQGVPAGWSNAMPVPNDLDYVDGSHNSNNETRPTYKTIRRTSAAGARLNGQPALVILCMLHDLTRVENALYYRVGLKLSGTGVVTGGWTKDVQGNPAWICVLGWDKDDFHEKGIAVIVAKLKNDSDMIVFFLRRNPGKQDYSGYYKIGWNMDKDGIVKEWSKAYKVPGSFGPYTKGVSIAVTNVDDNTNPDLIVFCIDHPDSGNAGYYRIGKNMNLVQGSQTYGEFSEWTDYKAPFPVEGPFGLDNGGVGLAAGDISKNGNPDLIFFHIENNPPTSKGYCRIRWDIGNFFEQGLKTEVRIPGCAPFFGGPFEIAEKRTQAEQGGQRQRTEAVYLENQKINPANLIYLEEAWYFVPMQLCLAMQKSGEYTAALDWLRSVYDDRFPLEQRKIYYGLKREEQWEGVERPADWLRDVLNPHLIAATRTNAYTRYTLFSLIGCLLDYADDEYAVDTGESIARARDLYRAALKLLGTPELVYQDVPLNMDVATALKLPNAIHAEVPALNKSILQQGFDLLPKNWLDSLQHGVLDGLLDGFLDNLLSVTALLAFVIPPNPVLQILQERAQLNLGKIQSGCNIAGLRRPLEPYAVSVELNNTSLSARSIQSTTEKVVLYPTIYRYHALIERARQLAQMSAQIESGMFTAMERQAAATYTLLTASQGLQLAQANITLQDLRLSEAKKSEILVELQMKQRQFQETHFENLLAEGCTDKEKHALYELNEQMNSLEAAKDLKNLSDFIGVFSSGFSGAMSGMAGGAAGAVLGGILGTGSGIVNGLLSNKQMESSLHGLKSQLSAMEASYERRSLDWLYQLGLVRQDKQIIFQQKIIAQDNTRVVAQEGLIARMQLENADAIVTFLSNQFLNPDLYGWMSNVLEGIYRFFLQQATAMARLAAQQLAFERHETVPDYIQNNYWRFTSGDTSNIASNSNEDRHGLTGSARLLRDITQLDQYAFAQDKRKLQITKTFSLTQLVPYEFSRFRQNGVLVFSTPLELFDRDFPGHYLRLIKRVRVSMVALVPPSQGIKATLYSSGISRVVVPGNPYKTEIIRRDPEIVALSSPQSASGLFELDMQSDMLWPFESSGVDMRWEFRLPKAANAINYSNIGDVLVTMEYTALSSQEYYQQVVRQLDRQFQAERAFSLRSDFVDAWYELHNPDQSDLPMTVSWQTLRSDYPPNLENLRIQQIVLLFVGGNISQELVVDHLGLKEAYGRVGGSAVSSERIISTRRSNGMRWMTMLGKPPIGTWELTLSDTPEVRAMFERNEIEDIVLIITYSGELPAWPA